MAEIFVFRSDETPKLNYRQIHTLFSELGLEQGLLVFERVLHEVPTGYANWNWLYMKGTLK
ncbi:MAG: hypothetical protein V7761_01175 [Amylibacter sp.]